MSLEGRQIEAFDPFKNFNQFFDAGCGGKDPRVINVIGNKYGNLFMACAMSFTRGDRTLAETIYWEGLHNIYKNFPRLDPNKNNEEQFRGWATQTVKNLAKDRTTRSPFQKYEISLDKLMADSEADIDELPCVEFLGRHTPSAEAQYLPIWERGEIFSAINTLPPEQARLIVGNRFYDITHRELADLEGIPIGTVKGRIHYGYQKLRPQLVHLKEAA